MILTRKIITCAVISIVYALIFTGCAPRQTVRTEEEKADAAPKISTIQGDTLSYSIEFSSTDDRDRFLNSFQRFLKDYPFAKLQETESSIVIRILPVKGTEEGNEQAELLSNQRSEYVGNVIQKAMNESLGDSLVPEDTITPSYGGSVKIYTQRGVFDETFSRLVNMDPFENPYGNTILTIADSTVKRITLRMSSRIINGKGKIVSALDFIDTWTSFIKVHPAEGLALFRHIEGVREFIDGREAVVRGFLATDQSTIQIRLSQPDPDVLNRIRTPRLISGGLKLGEYFIDASTADETTLLSNKPAGRKYGYLDKMIIRNGGEANPILSYSLKKYDAVTLLSVNDLDYARNNLLKTSLLTKTPDDRYFISFANTDLQIRKYLASLINPQEILKNFVKAEGSLISRIETEQDDVSGQIEIASPGVLQPVKILFRKDDPVSKIVAEKILADFTQVNVPGALVPANQTEYERNLVTKNYGCAIGWVSDDIRTDRSERLRLSTIWFGDDTNEQARIDRYSELPLFRINRFVLSRSNIIIPGGDVEKMFVKPAQSGN